MALLNYTTTIDVHKTVSQVHGILVQAGARAIMAEYGEAGEVAGVSFVVETPFGRRGYTLPVNTERVHAVLLRQKLSARYSSFEQAERVAWRILKDWIEAQVALLETEMVTLDQVMLPYMRDAEGRTVYELYLDNQLALPGGKEE